MTRPVASLLLALCRKFAIKAAKSASELALAFASVVDSRGSPNEAPVAAGTPILLVRMLLGLEPDRAHQRLVSTVRDELPSWLDGLRLEGVRAFGRVWSVAVERGQVSVTEGV